MLVKQCLLVLLLSMLFSGPVLAADGPERDSAADFSAYLRSFGEEEPEPAEIHLDR